MDPKVLRPNADYFEQLGLGLDLDEEARSASGFVSPEEAKRRSMAAFKALEMAGLESMPNWMSQYQELLDAGWPWRVACFIAWSASPKIQRWPKTQEELATTVLGLTSDRQIATWRKRNRSIDEIITVLQAAPLMAHRADVFQALAISASDKDHRSNPDRKLFLELTNDYVPRQKVDFRREDVDDLSGMSEAELEKLAKLAVSGSLSPEEGSGRRGGEQSAVSGERSALSGEQEDEE
jgi:hypothetical protein